MKPSSLFRSLSLSLLTVLGRSTLLFGQGTAFTYQGLLNNNGTPANGSFDLQFTLFPTNATGSALAGPVTNLAVPVSNGLFTATVDFGNAFTGPSTWLELAVSTNAANTFSTLTPRQPLLPVPSAIFANSTSNLLGNLPAAQLSGPIPVTNITGILPLSQLPPGILTNTQSTVILSGAFTGDGSGLTNSTPLAALGPDSVPGSNAVAAMIVALAPSGPATISITNITGILPLSQLPPGILTNTQTAVSLAGAFTGDGSGLTNTTPLAALGPNSVPGSNAVASMIVALAPSFPSTISITNITGILPLSQLPPGVLTNTQTAVTLSGAFVGDGSGLTNSTPLAALGPNSVPGSNAVAAMIVALAPSGPATISITNVTGTLPLSQLPPGILTNTQTAVTLSGAFAGDGSGLTNSTPLAALGPNSVPGSNAVAAMIVALAPGGPGGAATNAIAFNNGAGNNTTFNPNSGSGKVAITVNGTEVHGVTTNQAMLITQIGYETNLNGTAHNAWSAGTYFSGVYDPIYCEGFNVAPGGNALIPGQQAWYHQREYNYYYGAGMGLIYMEDHLDAVTTNATSYRPYQIDVDINGLHNGTNDYFDLNSYVFNFTLPYSSMVFAQLTPSGLQMANKTGTEGFWIYENGSGGVFLLPNAGSANQILDIGLGTGNNAWSQFALYTKLAGSITLNSSGLTLSPLQGPVTASGALIQVSANSSSDLNSAAVQLFDTAGTAYSRNWAIVDGGTGNYGAPGQLSISVSATPNGDPRPAAGGYHVALLSTNSSLWFQTTAFTNAGTAAATIIASNTITTGFITATNFTGNGGGLTHLNAAQVSGTLPLATLPGLTTNVSTGGITFHITNGLIMRVTSP